MGLLFRKKNDNRINDKKSNNFLKYAIPVGIGLYAKSKSDKRKAMKSSPKGQKVLGGLFRKKAKDNNKVFGGLFRTTGKGIFKKK